jgi:hypothetical protein
MAEWLTGEGKLAEHMTLEGKLAELMSVEGNLTRKTRKVVGQKLYLNTADKR